MVSPESANAAQSSSQTALEEAQFNELVGTITDYPIFVLDADGHVQTWNEGARQLKGYAEDEIIDEHFSRFYTEEDREAGLPEENLRTALEDGRIEDEGVRVQKGGDTFWATVTITALSDDDGDLRGFAKVTRDMTERHEYEERLREQRDELDELNQINTVIRDIDQGLVQATTREEIQRIVCDSLTVNDRFRFARIGVPYGVGERLTPLAWSGSDRGYLDEIELTSTPGSQGAVPAVRTAETGEVTMVSNVAENLRGGAWRKAAFKREFQSIISVPLTHGDVSYGVLTLYADRPEIFEEMERSVFAELGDTIANTINAVDTRESLLNDQAVELEFQLRSDSSSFLARLAGEIGTEITFEGMIPLSEDSARLFFVVHGGDADELDGVLDRSVAVESYGVIASSDEGHRVEAVASGRTVALSLLDYGAGLRSFTIDEDGVRLFVDLPSSRDGRGFVTRFQSQYEDAEFLARRERERPVQTKDGLYAELEAYLTERQLEVLETAYYSGFLDSPR